jgi:hypothetical protein
MIETSDINRNSYSGKFNDFKSKYQSQSKYGAIKHQMGHPGKNWTSYSNKFKNKILIHFVTKYENKQ